MLKMIMIMIVIAITVMIMIETTAIMVLCIMIKANRAQQKADLFSVEIKILESKQINQPPIPPK